MPRFTILHHDFPHRHWDFLLEAGDYLRSWRLEGEPHLGTVIRADDIADHRLKYLDYEGPVSGGRGQVDRWDSGLYTQIRSDHSRVIVALEGVRCRGQVTLECISGQEWRF